MKIPEVIISLYLFLLRFSNFSWLSNQQCSKIFLIFFHLFQQVVLFSEICIVKMI